MEESLGVFDTNNQMEIRRSTDVVGLFLFWFGVFWGFFLGFFILFHRFIYQQKSIELQKCFLLENILGH